MTFKPCLEKLFKVDQLGPEWTDVVVLEDKDRFENFCVQASGFAVALFHVGVFVAPFLYLLFW